MKILMRTAIGLLAAFHAVVGYTALHPQVSDHYRDYYITGTDFMSPWQHHDLVVLRPDTHLKSSGVTTLRWDFGGQCHNHRLGDYVGRLRMFESHLD